MGQRLPSKLSLPNFISVGRCFPLMNYCRLITQFCCHTFRFINLTFTSFHIQPPLVFFLKKKSFQMFSSFCLDTVLPLRSVSQRTGLRLFLMDKLSSEKTSNIFLFPLFNLLSYYLFFFIFTIANIFGGHDLPERFLKNIKLT